MVKVSTGDSFKTVIPSLGATRFPTSENKKGISMSKQGQVKMVILGPDNIGADIVIMAKCLSARLDVAVALDMLTLTVDE